MSVRILHRKQSVIANNPAKEISRNAWNDTHAITQETGKILGRTSAGEGETEEITPDSSLSLSGGSIGINTASEAERIRDVISSALVSGSGILITPNDAGDVITISFVAPLGPHAYYASDVVPNDSSPAVATANAAAINAWMATIAAAGGGTLILPAGLIYVSSALDNKYSRVLVKGAGDDFFHDVAGTYGTTIVPTFAGTVLRHRTDYLGASHPKNSGGGFIGLTVIGNGLATLLLDIDSVNRGQYELTLLNCVGSYAARLRCGVSFTDIGEAADNQSIKSLRLAIRQVDGTAAQACGGLLVTGSINANSSIFTNAEIDVQHYNGIGVDLQSCDGVVINRIRSFSLGTGKPIVFRGPTASNPVGAEHCIILQYSANAAGHAEGTDTAGVTAGTNNCIFGIDKGNSTPLVTSGTGSFLFQVTTKGDHHGARMNTVAFGDGPAATALAAAALLGSECIRAYSGSDAQFIVQSPTGSWALRTLNSNGDFQIVRIAGSGIADIANLASNSVRTNGSFANDAAAAAAGIAIGQFYRNGSVVQCRVT